MVEGRLGLKVPLLAKHFADSRGGARRQIWPEQPGIGWVSGGERIFLVVWSFFLIAWCFVSFLAIDASSKRTKNV